MSTVALYLHTVRYLRPLQIANRVWRELYRPAPDRRAAPPLRARQGVWAAPVAPAPTLVGPTRVRLLNLERDCATPGDWRPADASLLFKFHLHYFDDLNAVDASQRSAWHRALLERWVAENPPGSDIAWHPYPTSRRIVNWIKWALRGNALPRVCVDSLAVQLRWLNQRLEYHLLGNHLLVNAKALAFGAAFFDGAEAASWQRRAARLLDAELEEQVLADGGHFELSPMYHAAVLEDLLDLVNLRRAFSERVPPPWIESAVRMSHWLAAMTHADGGIAFFNDAAFEQAPTLSDLEAYAERLQLRRATEPAAPLVWLAASGYVRAQCGSAQLFCDCAAIGPNHLPAHAHADTLSFELSVAGQRLFVNSGTSEYGEAAERARQRGTAAHNTVVVDSTDSSEVWSGFRVARRARIVECRAEIANGAVVVTAAHDGYRRLAGRNLHRRTWRMQERRLVIDDEVVGAKRSAVAWFHLHPAVSVRRAGGAAVDVEWPGGEACIVFDGAEGIKATAGTWHPRFGASMPNTAIAVGIPGARLRTRIEWSR